MTIMESLINGSNLPVQGKLLFHSNVHQRYEYGIPVRGEQLGCHRDVKIENNISGKEGYSVSILNVDATNSFMGIVMGSKPMKIIHCTKQEIELRGFGYDVTAVMIGVPMCDASYANYGMTIKVSKNQITNCVIPMIDRNVDIDYYVK